MPNDYQMYIAGQWCDSSTGQRSDVFSPANGELIGTVPEGSREDVARAVAAASAAGRAWARRSAFERGAALERVAQRLWPCRRALLDRAHDRPEDDCDRSELEIRDW